jgi:hypothetical protein
MTSPDSAAVLDSAADLAAELASVGVARFTATDYGPGRVIHIVLFKYSDAATAAERAEVSRRFTALVSSERDGRPYIRSIVAGPQLSGEVAPGGFEDGFVIEFESLGDRNFYVGEPVVADPEYFDHDHAAFKSFVGPFIAGVQVFDLQP